MIQGLERVVLQTDLPPHGLRVGDVGIVVMVHYGGQGYTVQFQTLAGETVAVVTLAAEQVRAIKPNEVTHAREMGTA